MEILTWALLILLLLTMSVKIVKLGKRVKKVEKYIGRKIQKEMHEELKRLFGSMDDLVEELLANKTEKNERKNLTKGVKIEAGENECVVDLFVIMDYGHSIPDVSWNIQSNVKEAIEGMTGLDVIEVNVHVQGVHLPEKEENHNDEEQEEQKEE
jgi:uncharacterized alkaline shock family protein YloU